MAGRAGRLIGTAGLALAISAGLVTVAPSHAGHALARCPLNERPNPAGYGCVPSLAPGGNSVGAPSQEELSACHGNLYYCVDPYAGYSRP
ncbi:MAG TPA: hypothetical protein VMU34_20390 [Mycobacterium sp.]|nr:hypothetical protein [Mycobacterium sp.]